MNRIHGLLCSSKPWARMIARDYLPWALEGTPLEAKRVLEIGPGYGATTRALVGRVGELTAIEVDPLLANALSVPGATIVLGDGSAMPFDDGAFDAVVCFTMLHHVPSVALQDCLFAEAFRVLRPGGKFAGSDSTTSFGFRLLHIGDTMVMVDPEAMPGRLSRAGFVSATTSRRRGSFRFRAEKPSA